MFIEYRSSGGSDDLYEGGSSFEEIRRRGIAKPNGIDLIGFDIRSGSIQDA